MMLILHALLGFLLGTFRAWIGLQLEIVALRHQLALYRRSIWRPSIRPGDRMLWACRARR